MAWSVRLNKDAEKQLKRYDPKDQRRLIKFLRERIAEEAGTTPQKILALPVPRDLPVAKVAGSAHFCSRVRRSRK